MATWYLDPENGNDSNDGLSFANRKKILDNPSGFADGDEIRIIKSPDATSIGNATWERDATFTQSGVNGRLTTATFAGQASGTPTSVADTSHGLITGDAIFVIDNAYNYAGVHMITKVDDNTFTLDGTENAAQTASVSVSYSKLSSFCVRLANSPIKNILGHQGLDGSGDKDWTAVQGTTGRDTNYYTSGYRSSKWFKPGNGATGKVAYCALDNALDLSGYQQISLKLLYDYVASGQKDDSGIFSLRLCTDTQGDTSVHTVPLDVPPGQTYDKWLTITVDLGTNLNSSIQSIALHVDIALEHASTEILLDNIIACKAKSSADSLTLQSVIGKGNTHNSVYYQIIGIVDKIVLLSSDAELVSGIYNPSYPKTETTETVTTYKREQHLNKTYYNTATRSDFIYIRNHYNFSISGGWNTTDMSSQDSNSGSWLGHSSNYFYSALWLDECGKFNISNIGAVGGYYPFNIEFAQSIPRTRSNTISNCNFILNYREAVVPNCLYDNCIFNSVGTTTPAVGDTDTVYKNCTFIDTLIQDYDAVGRKNYVGCTFRGSQVEELLFGTNGSSQKEYNNVADEFSNCTFKRLTLAHGEDWKSHYSFPNCTFEDVNFFDYLDADSGFKQDRLPAFSFINYNDTANDHRLYYINCLVTSDSSVTQSGSGYSWKMTPLSTTTKYTRDVDSPLEFNIAKVAVAANAQVTATIYARRTGTSTNDYVSLAALLINNGSVGLTSDIKSSALSAGANTWQQLTLTFTPTVAGVATISALMSASSTSNSVFVDSLSITQA